MSNSCSNSICNTPLFAGLDCSKFGQFCASARIKKYDKGEIIAREGNPCTSIGVLVKGEAALQRISSGGEFATISLISDGDFFGEDIIYSSHSKYKTTIEAMTSCFVQYFSRKQIDDLMREEPLIKDNFLRLLSDRVNSQNRRIELLSQKTLREKIAYYLIDLYNNSDKTTGTVVELPVTKEVVSKLLAMPRPSFSRELAAMERDGLLKVSGRKIELCDVSRLEKEIVEGLSD